MRAGLLMVGIVLLAGLLGPWIVGYDPSTQLLEQRLAPPSAGHPLGLDELGRDILARLIQGTRVSLFVGLSVVTLAAVVGTFVGGFSGYVGGRLDDLLMRLADLLLAFPGILLAIALVAVLGPGVGNVIFALAAIGWVGYARLVRGRVLALREEPFIEAARAAGAPTLRILARHVVPNIASLVVVQASLGMAGTIVAEAGLSFLGLGIQPPASSWGSMIETGRAHLLDAPHLALFPGLAIVWTVVGLNLLGDGLVDRWSEAPSDR